MKTQTWNRVRAPIKWNPKDGEELIGVYIGSQTRSGSYGDYLVHFIKKTGRTYMVSGIQLNNLFALIGEGEPIKLIFTGMKTSKTDQERKYKTFDLYTESIVEFKLVG